jgi:hypothetical protein
VARREEQPLSLKSSNAVVIIIAVCMLVVFPLALTLLRGDASSVLLDYIKVVLSWPVAILILGLILFTRFHDAVDSLIRNVKSVKLPGGSKIQTWAAPAVGAGTTPPREGRTITGSATATGRGTATAKAEVIKAGASSGAEALSDELRWKFSYLANFFVPNTKRVLLWFHEKGELDRVDYHAFWSSLIPGLDQATVILGVLLQYGMLKDERGTLRMTDEGSKFLHFIGFSPY